MRIVETPIFTFDELEDRAKDAALSRLRENAFTDSWDWDHIFEDAATIGDLLGFDLRQKFVKTMDGSGRYAPAIFFRGFCSQGDGACFESTYRYAPGAEDAITAHCGGTDKTLVAIAARLQAMQKSHFYKLRATTVQSGHYCHEYSMRINMECDCARCQGYAPGAETEEEFKEICADFARWIYRNLEKEYEYQTSNEALIEVIAMNEHEFYEDGRMV